MPPVDPLFQLLREEDFKSHIESSLQNVRKACRDQTAINMIKNLVPIAQLVQDNIEVLEGDYHDNLLPVLVNWFSTDFFTWYQPPDCEDCGAQLEFRKNSRNVEGKSVEHYACPREGCDAESIFIRHNDPVILLHTRTGRCGEWANCFMMILKAMDYDVRYICDTTDHAWNEIFSESQDRWIHVDPCEGVIDAPLLYEVGWSKKLEYCIALSEYEVVDVTPRYSINYEETRARRTAHDETRLDKYLDARTYLLVESIESEKVRSDVLRRRALDKDYLTRLMSNPRPIPDKIDFQGRRTGSIAWRIQRGEYSPYTKNSYIIKAPHKTKSHESEPLFSFKYNCDKDEYESTIADFKKKRWHSLTYEFENVDRKFEKDWKTSYIARYEGCPPDKNGRIVWRFDISQLEDLERVDIFFRCEIYPKTTVLLKLVSYSEDFDDILMESQLSCNQKDSLTRLQISPNAKFLDLIAVLTGGDQQDCVAWQKPQLFRQTRGKNSDEWSLDFSVF